MIEQLIDELLNLFFIVNIKITVSNDTVCFTQLSRNLTVNLVALTIIKLKIII